MGRLDQGTGEGPLVQADRAETIARVVARERLATVQAAATRAASAPGTLGGPGAPSNEVVAGDAQLVQLALDGADADPEPRGDFGRRAAGVPQIDQRFGAARGPTGGRADRPAERGVWSGCCCY